MNSLKNGEKVETYEVDTIKLTSAEIEDIKYGLISYYSKYSITDWSLVNKIKLLESKINSNIPQVTVICTKK